MHDDSQDTISIFREHDGVGAIQLSFAERTSRKLPSPEEVIAIAKKYATQREWRVPDDAVRLTEIDGSPCAVFEYVQSGDESSYWQVWHILDSTRLVFITYVCDSNESTAELSERNAVVASLKWSR